MQKFKFKKFLLFSKSWFTVTLRKIKNNDLPNAYLGAE